MTKAQLTARCNKLEATLRGLKEYVKDNHERADLRECTPFNEGRRIDAATVACVIGWRIHRVLNDK